MNNDKERLTRTANILHNYIKLSKRTFTRKTIQTMTFPSFYFLLFCATLLTLTGCIVPHATKGYPQYTYRKHPLYTLPQFSSKNPPRPEIVRDFSFTHSDEPLVSRILYAPRAASYDVWPTRESFSSNLDVLITPSVPLDDSNSEKFLSVRLNDRARVVVLMACRGLNLEKHLSGEFSTTGLPNGWSKPVAVIHNSSNLERLGDPLRWGENLFPLVGAGVAVEIPLSDDLEIVLPHPSTIELAGLPVLIYLIMFANPDIKDKLVQFEQPSVPESFTALDSDANDVEPGSVIDPLKDPPVPNRTCPKWLHDLYVTSRNGFEDMEKIKKNEPGWWMTWHPPIDSIYWCYYTHEHGSYPGHYLPPFGYTAWKTPDDSKKLGRQDEPHNGFKVYAIKVADLLMDTDEDEDDNDGDGNEGERIIIATVHQLVSTAKRFTERKHTMNWALFRQLEMDATENMYDWEMEMELFMKMDFGPSEVIYANKTIVPNGETGIAIAEDLLKKSIKAGRRFNVLNLDDGFPDTVDMAYLMKGKPSEGIKYVMRGVYEQWHGPLISCTASNHSKGINRGIVFDIRDPSTSMRTPKAKDDEDMSFLAGKSTNRIAVIPQEGMIVGPEYCGFEMADMDNVESVLQMLQNTDSFFTDSSFKVVLNSNDEWAVRQFIKGDMKELSIPGGLYTPVSPWFGYMEVEEGGGGRRRFLDIEQSVLQTEN